MTKKLTLVGIASMVFAAAQAPPAAPAKKFADDKEQNMAIAANNEKDPKAQVEKLDLWKAAYPTTQYDVERLNLYFQDYQKLGQFHDQILVSEELLKKLPDNFTLLRTIMVDYGQLKPPSADDVTAATAAAKNIVENRDTIFASAKAKENGMTPAQFEQLKPQMVAYAKTLLDKIVEDQGRDAVIAAIKADPTRVSLNVWLGQQILADVKKHPEQAEQQGVAIYHYARAAAYAGPGALDAGERGKMKTFVDRAYKTYHGSAEGEDKLMAQAAAEPLPGDYKIASNVDVAKNANAADAEWRNAHPMLAAWRDTKAILTGDDGQAKFDADIKDSELPQFTGKIVSMTPALRPKSVVVLIDGEKDGAADCTLTFETALAGKMEPGEELQFVGVAKSFVKDPYMLTVTVEKDKLTGWTGKNAPAAHRPAKKGN